MRKLQDAKRFGSYNFLLTWNEVNKLAKNQRQVYFVDHFLHSKTANTIIILHQAKHRSNFQVQQFINLQKLHWNKFQIHLEWQTKATQHLFKLHLREWQINNKINNQIIYWKAQQIIWLLDILTAWHKIYSNNNINSDTFCFQSISYILSQILYALLTYPPTNRLWSFLS